MQRGRRKDEAQRFEVLWGKDGIGERRDIEATWRDGEHRRVREVQQCAKRRLHHLRRVIERAQVREDDRHGAGRVERAEEARPPWIVMSVAPVPTCTYTAHAMQLRERVPLRSRSYHLQSSPAAEGTVVGHPLQRSVGEPQAQNYD